MGVGVQHHAPANLTPWKRGCTYCTGGWMDLCSGLNGCSKFPPPPEGLSNTEKEETKTAFTNWLDFPIRDLQFPSFHDKTLRIEIPRYGANFECVRRMIQFLKLRKFRCGETQIELWQKGGAPGIMQYRYTVFVTALLTWHIPFPTHLQCQHIRNNSFPFISFTTSTTASRPLRSGLLCSPFCDPSTLLIVIFFITVLLTTLKQKGSAKKGIHSCKSYKIVQARKQKQQGKRVAF
jgi:hypothetical protein